MIYLDNAATSCPKPPEVIAAVTQALEEVCANPSRGAYELSLRASRSLLDTRRAAARLFGIADDSRVIFTLNATHALNMALKGLLSRRGPGDRASVHREGGDRAPHHHGLHVVTSSLEHNSVTRPLAALARNGVEVTRVPCGRDGVTDPELVLAAVRPDTALVVMTHASNVLGTVLPVAEVGPRLRERGVPFLVDAAQTAGCLSLDVERMGISLLAASGHKGLLGPQGVGILYVAPDIALDTLYEGGTGSLSESLEQPLVCPDRYEAGTPNSPGIAGLGAGIKLLLEQGVSVLGQRQLTLARLLYRGLRDIDGVRVHGPWTSHEPWTSADTDAMDQSVVPIVSIALEGLGSARVAHVLDKEFGIAARAGLHCAPEAHRVAGTLNTGLVRLSIGHTTTDNEVDQAVAAIAEIASRPVNYWTHEWETQHAR